MSDVKWIKLSTQMFEDEKIRLIESMPEADTILIVWVKLLSQAGRANNNGYIYLSENIPYTDEMLATIFNRPLGTVRMALETFRRFGMIEVDENQFISITNWEKHQNIAGLDKIREQNRIRKQKEREKKKLPAPSRDGHVTITPSHATEQEQELDLELEEDVVVVVDNSPGMAFRFYEDNIHPLTPHVAEVISKMIDESSEELVHESLKRSVEANAGNKIKFAEAILRAWQNKRLKTISDVIADDKAFERNKQKQGQSSIKSPEQPKQDDPYNYGV